MCGTGLASRGCADEEQLERALGNQQQHLNVTDTLLVLKRPGDTLLESQVVSNPHR
jgi:hypothetical protein